MPQLNSTILITLSLGTAIIYSMLFIMGIGIFGYIIYRFWYTKINRDTIKQDESSKDAYLEFIDNISHEISNPLQSISTNLDNMSKCSPEEIGRWQQIYLTIKGQIRRLVKITSNLRKLAELEEQASISRESINIREVIEDVIREQAEYAESKNVRIAYKGPENPARIFGNRDLIEQSILNLVDNGIKYSKRERGVTIISVQDKEEDLCIRIIDEGIGIAEEDLPYIFETVYRAPTLRTSGSGLGLALVKKTVEIHGGKIKVDSQKGEGTTISINLPLFNPS